jgi:hypothetical protein
MDGYPLPSIPPHVLQPGVEPGDVQAEAVFEKWISELNSVLSDKSYEKISDLFLDDCWWRDFVSLNWDFSSKHGQTNIIKYLKTATNSLSNLQTVHIGGLKPLLVQLPGMVWIQGAFTFKNQHGSGHGLLKLLNVGTKDEWKAWSIFTQLEKLDFQEELERRKALNPAAVNRQPQVNGVHEEDESAPVDVEVLIVGAGMRSCTFP